MNKKYVVVVNRGSVYGQYFYVGESELAAMKVLRGLKMPNKELVRVVVKKCTMFGYDLIHSLSEVEKIL